MANQDFHKVVVRDAHLKYPRLNSTYRYNTQTQKSEQCPQTVSGASWAISWESSVEDATALYNELKAHYLARKAENPKMPEFKTVFGMKPIKDDNGNTVAVDFTAKRAGVNKSGELNQPPRVVDKFKQPLENLEIWSGSKGNLSLSAAPTRDPDGNGGISLFITAIQVTEPVYGGGGIDDFDVYEDEDEFSAPAAQKDSLQAGNSNRDSIGQSIGIGEATVSGKMKPGEMTATAVESKPMDWDAGDDVPF